MRLAAAGLGIALLTSLAAAREVTFPLAVDHVLLGAALARQLGAEPDGRAVLWEAPGGCRSLRVRDLRLDGAAGLLRLAAEGKARLGFGLLGFCLAPLSWAGNVETLARPEVGDDWQLHLRDLDSHLYDGAWRRTLVASRVWDLVKDRLERRVGDFTFDLAPPVAEAKGLLRVAMDSDRARSLVAALETLHPVGIDVDEEGVKVRVVLELPPDDAAPPPEPVAEAMEPARWQGLLESWDGFVVFVVKDLGVVDADPAVRDQLLSLLLRSRLRLLATLAAGPVAGRDPVRELFLDAWEELRGIVRESAAHDVPRDRLLRYASFVTAGDALRALDTAAPSLGLEISTPGLRRLALVLDPGYSGDPLAHTEAPDPTLRGLFRFHEPEPGLSPSEVAPPRDSWFGPRAAFAEAPPDEVRVLARKLDRWVPAAEELLAYRDAVARLLALVTERTASTNTIEPRLAEVYRVLVPATAWQESCWRQFVARDGSVVPLLSKSGDVGIMQVNRRVWRGFFDLAKLEWDVAYNAGAGAEILAQLLTRYGAREAAGRLENAARATYSAYNGGPDAYRRYRLQRVPHLQRAVDRAFWEKYQAMAAGRALDLVLCVERWSPPPGPRLSVAPLASTPKCSISSRSSAATAWISARHASIASRPRDSFVKSPLEKPCSMAS